MAPSSKKENVSNGGITCKSKTNSTKEILYDNFYYDVSDWVKVHPGGRIIDFYTETGEDATIAIQQFHHRTSKKVMAVLSSFKCRPATDSEIGMDETTLKRHRTLTKDFAELHKQLEAEGLFKPSPLHVTYRILELVFFLTIGVILLSTKNSLACTVLGITIASIYYARCGFLAHEFGHRALTGNLTIDKFIEIVAFGFGDGLSASWWCSHHNRHHAMPQRIQRDVDLETLPLLAFNTKIGQQSKLGKSFLIRNQAIFFLTIDAMLVIYFWKFYLHPRCTILKKNYHELVAMASHYIFMWYFWPGFWLFFIGIWLSSMYMLGTFSLSHTHLPVTTKALHWVEYGFLHTMDVNPSWWCDWWMGYLNYQIEHHLFPSIPHFRLYRIRDRVKALAAKHGIPYQCVSYCEAIQKTFSNLIHVSKELQDQTF